MTHKIGTVFVLVSNHLEDSIQKSHQYKFKASSNLNQNLDKPELILLNLFMKRNHSYAEPNETNLRLFVLDYFFNLIFYDSLKWNIEGDQNYSEYSDENEKVTITSKEEFIKSELPENKTRNELVEKTYFIRTTQNGYELHKVNYSQKIGIKHTMVYSKIKGEEEMNLENSTDFVSSSSVLEEIQNFGGNKSHKSLEKVVNIYNGPNKGENEKDNFIKTQSNSSSTTIQKLKHKISLKFNPSLYKLTLTNYHHSPSILLRTLMPRKIVKRSSLSASSRQLETPTDGNFPVSIAGSSLYGTYAYAHTRPSGFGIFPTPGGEEGEDGETTEEGENVE